MSYVFGSANWFLDDWAFSGGEVERQVHDFEREEEVGEDDGGIDSENFSGGDGDFGG